MQYELKWTVHGSKFGMKPHRRWKVSQVKAYFGIKGNRDTLLKRFEALKAEVDELVENIN